ncbi:MAG: hypothetical protein GY854_08895 [Deltaproteobacteria bacterium]|nr:hypothetical protein [Deltaproteobacteria bacterium]
MERLLRKKIDREEFDYLSLMSALSEYANPRNKITSLLSKGVIIRVKKGLYVFGADFRERPFSRELLANLMYGPSFVSLDYALSYYGLVPETVTIITSVTTKRPKRFQTPTGLFVYRATRKLGFHLGMTRVEHGSVAFLVACPERALADKLRDHRSGAIRTQSGIAEYLFEDLRIDAQGFAKMDAALLEAIGRSVRSQKILQAVKLLRSIQRKKT